MKDKAVVEEFVEKANCSVVVRISRNNITLGEAKKLAEEMEDRMCKEYWDAFAHIWQDGIELERERI